MKTVTVDDLLHITIALDQVKDWLEADGDFPDMTKVVTIIKECELNDLFICVSRLENCNAAYYHISQLGATESSRRIEEAIEELIETILSEATDALASLRIQWAKNNG